MSEKKKPSPQKGEFIDLEKDQYKKNINFKKYLFVMFTIVVLILLTLLYFNFFSFNHVSIFNKIDKQNESMNEQILSTNTKKEYSQINSEQINLIKERLENLRTEIVNNQNKLSETSEIISNLTRQIQSSEIRNQQNLNFFVAEKYIILNALLNLKQKFKNRQEFKSELNILESRLNDQFEIRNLILFFENSNIQTISKVDDLLERINKKINYYEYDLNAFITSKVNENSNENLKIIGSKEELIIYLKNLFNSTFKVSKVDRNTNFQFQPTFEDLDVLKVLKKSKEYLLVGNINKSIDVLKNSSIDDYEINQWIDDASILVNSREKLEILESNLLEIIGKDVN